ncbi:uncharacterized protein LOC110372598 isoform X2 [Helicoverpa armigera]|uniref:uncharacterized protein LOC110372598 isoform X2 n=1 Tax=Helicoverpa armigera TaxID=29058 RepID=UPI0030839C21
MQKLSLAHLLIIGAFLIVAVQSRICSRISTKTSLTVEGHNNPGDVGSTSKPSHKQKIRHAKRTHMITYHCSEEDYNEISEAESKGINCIDCKYCSEDGTCFCNYGLLINNPCVNFCEICNQNGRCVVGPLGCECKTGTYYFREACPLSGVINSPTASTHADLYSTVSGNVESSTVRAEKSKVNINDRLNNTSNSTGSLTSNEPLNLTESQGYDEVTKRSLNVTTLESDQPHQVVKPISTDSVVSNKNNSNGLDQAPVVSRMQQNGMSIIISIILGNYKCGNQNTLLGGCSTGN